MYRTLIKNESRLQGRALLTILAISATVVAGAIGLVLLNVPVLSPLAILLGVLAIVALAGGTPLFLLWRYYQSMYGREGYLTHVVPVKPAALYAAKYTWALVVSLLALAASAVLAGALMLASAVANGASVSTLWQMVVGFFGNLSGMQATLVVLAMVGGLALYIAQFGWIVTFGMEDRFRKLGIGGPVLIWFLNYIAMQILLLAGLLLIPLGITPDLGRITTTNFASELLGTTPGQSELGVIPLGFVPVLAVSFVAYVVWTIHSIKKHTSLR